MSKTAGPLLFLFKDCRKGVEKKRRKKWRLNCENLGGSLSVSSDPGSTHAWESDSENKKRCWQSTSGISMFVLIRLVAMGITIICLKV